MMLSGDAKKLLMIGGLCVAALNIGRFLQGAAWVVGAPATAYAAKEQAATVDAKFQEYLTRQEAYTKAVTDYVNQQAQQQAPNQPTPSPEPAPVYHWKDREGQVWCCDKRADCNQRAAWWRCEEGR